MKISKLKAISIAICCLVASLWSEAQCMEGKKGTWGDGTPQDSYAIGRTTAKTSCTQEIKEIERDYSTSGQRFNFILPGSGHNDDKISDDKAKLWFKSQLYEMRPSILEVIDVSYKLNWKQNTSHGIGSNYNYRSIESIKFRARFKE